jgi:hypothetical protein
LRPDRVRVRVTVRVRVKVRVRVRVWFRERVWVWARGETSVVAAERAGCRRDGATCIGWD